MNYERPIEARGKISFFEQMSEMGIGGNDNSDADVPGHGEKPVARQLPSASNNKHRSNDEEW